MNETGIFFSIVLLAFNNLIPLSFPLVEAPLKVLFEVTLLYFLYRLRSQILVLR